jgi:hypothetical protein
MLRMSGGVGRHAARVRQDDAGGPTDPLSIDGRRGAHSLSTTSVSLRAVSSNVGVALVRKRGIERDVAVARE